MHSRLFFAVLICVLVAFSGCSGATNRKGYTRVTKSSRVQKKAEIGYTSGEIFDRDKFTCAHRSLPFGTKLKVTRIKTGASVEVRVNDRGPYSKKRVLDLSEAAGKVLGLDKAGHAQVKAVVIE